MSSGTSDGTPFMGPGKSQVDIDFYIDLLRNILADAYARFPEIPRRDYEHDVLTVVRRCKFEGFSFLSKTLPKLGKALDRAAETGSLVVPREFSKKSSRGAQQNIPAFMSALFRTIFEPCSGTLVPCPRNAFGDIRQACYFAYKVEMAPSEATVKATVANFVSIDLSLPAITGRMLSNPVITGARSILAELFRGFDPADIKPKHGPGAVSDRLVARNKYKCTYFDVKIDRMYPYSVYYTGGANAGNLKDLVGHCTLPWRSSPPARVCVVPKDSRGPRIISCEPALMQYLQQGLGSKIVKLVENHPLTRGRVNFTNQTINRELAILGSKTRIFSTLDMKDASDRVSWDLVKLLFPEFLHDYLDCTRSNSTTLPNGEVMQMKKYAPMGSALCFPIEALVFYSLACAVVGLKTQRPARSVRSIFVYGDDIITISDDASDIITFFSFYGLKFNSDKCFVRGNFRESCGMDAFFGEDVTPVKIRALVRPGRSSRSDLYRLSKNASAFFDRGYWRTSEFLWSGVEDKLGPLPTAPHTFQGICRTSQLLPTRFRPNGSKMRWNDNLQRLEVKTLVPIGRKVSSPFPTDVQRLLHNLISGCEVPYDEDVAVSAGTALPKTRWMAAP